MSKQMVGFVFILFSFLICNYSIATEPKNLDFIKISLIKYHDSGAWRKDQAKIIAQAMQYLKTRLFQEKKLGHKKKLAIVLDIDETSLSNYPDMLKLGFGGTPYEIDKEEGLGDDPVITPTLELYRYAKANNVAVFFITGRRGNIRSGTEQNLIATGYSNWDGLIFKPLDYKEKTAAIYKIHARKQLKNQGFDIVLNIGDQRSDLVGGYAEKTFKLPNPYYIVP